MSYHNKYVFILLYLFNAYSLSASGVGVLERPVFSGHQEREMYKYFDSLSTIGVSNALSVYPSWGIIPASGNIVPVIVTQTSGTGDLVLSKANLQGKETRASAFTAFKYLHNHGFRSDTTKDIYMQTYYPLGDGPSTGVAMAVALASSMSQRPVDCTYAMTGAIDKNGEIKAVGCIRAKILAAKRHGCTSIIIPQDNWAEIQSDSRLRSCINIIPAKHLDDVFPRVLLAQNTLPLNGTKKHSPSLKLDPLSNIMVMTGRITGFSVLYNLISTNKHAWDILDDRGPSL